MGERRINVDGDVRAGRGHHLVDHGPETSVDLTKHVLLDRLQVLLAALQFFVCLAFLGLERLNAGAQRSIRLLAVERVDCGLDRLTFGAQRTGKRLLAGLKRSRLRLKRGLGGPASGAFAVDSTGVDDNDDGCGRALRLRRGGDDGGACGKRRKGEHMTH